MDYKDIRTLTPVSTDRTKLSGKAVLVHNPQTGEPMVFDADKMASLDIFFMAENASYADYTKARLRNALIVLSDDVSESLLIADRVLESKVEFHRVEGTTIITFVWTYNSESSAWSSTKVSTKFATKTEVDNKQAKLTNQQIENINDVPNKANKSTTYTKNEVDTAIASHHDATKQDVISDLSTIRSGASAGATAYQKPSGGIPQNDLSGDIKNKLDTICEVLHYQWDEDNEVWFEPEEDKSSNHNIYLNLVDFTISHVHALLSTNDTDIEIVSDKVVYDDSDNFMVYFSNIETSESSTPVAHRYILTIDCSEGMGYEKFGSFEDDSIELQEKITDLSTIRSGAALGATALQRVPDTYRPASEQDAIHDATKQDALTSAQLNAVNSGITADKVAEIAPVIIPQFDASSSQEVLKRVYDMLASCTDTTRVLYGLGNIIVLWYVRPRQLQDGTYRGEIAYHYESYNQDYTIIKYITKTGDTYGYLEDKKDLQTKLTDTDNGYGQRVKTLEGHDIVAQSLSLGDAAKEQARDNIGAIADAPSDTKQYARKNGAWEEVQSGSSTPSGHPCHSLFVDDGAVWNASTGYWELNGLTDITNEQMVAIHNAGSFGLITPFHYAGLNIRTNLPMKGIFHILNPMFGNTAMTISSSFDSIALDSQMEVFAFGENDNSAIANSKYTSWAYAYAFKGDTKLRKIQGIMPVNAAASNKLGGMFGGCLKLVTAKLSGLKTDLALSDSPNFDNASILFLIQNALNGTTNITIKLHADAWERADSDTAIQSALTTNGHITLSK